MPTPLQFRVPTTARRFTLFPIHEERIWKFYKQAEASFWTAEEIDLAQDIEQYNKLKEEEKHFIKSVLAFFAASDGIVNENLALRFYNDIEMPEARAFYTMQLQIETIHSETYSLLIDTYIREPAERERLFNALDHHPHVAKKAEWTLQWISSADSFAKRLIAFVCVEGIFFSASFCAIYWLKKQGKMPGLTFSNELISRDEGLHAAFSVYLHNQLGDHRRDIPRLTWQAARLRDLSADEQVLADADAADVKALVKAALPDATTDQLHSITEDVKSSLRVTEEEAHALFQSAVNVEDIFITDALPVDLIGMNAKTMQQYVRYVADYWLLELGFRKLYNVANPYDWMELISMEGKTNFFESRVQNYVKSGVGVHAEKRLFSMEEDF